MKLWAALYAMIWIVLIEFLLAMKPGGSQVLIYLHLILGFAIIVFAFNNFSGLRNTRVAGRVKRIAQASVNLSIAVAILGSLLFFNLGVRQFIPLINISMNELILFFHVFTSFAIITQASAVAIAYDMWEEREFEKESEPGIIPAQPKP